MNAERDITQTASTNFKCPRCGQTSYDEHDILSGYCGWCHDWTTDSEEPERLTIPDPKQ
jgi:ribosomal protein L37E